MNEHIDDAWDGMTHHHPGDPSHDHRWRYMPHCDGIIDVRWCPGCWREERSNDGERWRI